MADDNEDQWLYGDSNPEPQENDTNETKQTKTVTAPEEGSKPDQISEDPEPNAESTPPHAETNEDTEQANEPETNGNQENGEDFDDGDSDESEDDINVVIGDIKATPSYPSLNIKRSGLVTLTGGGDKTKQQSGKFSIDEFESIGTINGIAVQEYNLDSLEDKPWRKPGADITDYFNYGFSEETWRAYCERQKRMRVHESGAGLLPMNPGNLIRSAATNITNDNSKYSGNYLGPRKAGPPPGRRMMGSIDVIGGNSGLASRRTNDPLKVVPKENVIQVMTADRREYSRKPPAFPDMSIPPPAGSVPPFENAPIPPGPQFGGNNYMGDFYPSEPEPYFQSYEPTQEQQWGNDPTWTPTDIKELTPGPNPISTIAPVIRPGVPPIGPPGIAIDGAVPGMVPPPQGIASGPSAVAVMSPMLDSSSQDGLKNRDIKEESPTSTRERDHERGERDRDRDSHSRSDKPDRHRERSHRRDRSRSRSRRHKSRSRSPNHRSSHKKKKSSRRHDKSDSE